MLLTHPKIKCTLCTVQYNTIITIIIRVTKTSVWEQGGNLSHFFLPIYFLGRNKTVKTYHIWMYLRIVTLVRGSYNRNYGFLTEYQPSLSPMSTTETTWGRGHRYICFCLLKVHTIRIQFTRAKSWAKEIGLIRPAIFLRMAFVCIKISSYLEQNKIPSNPYFCHQYTSVGGPPPAMHSKRQPIPCHFHVERGLVLYIQYILPLGGESSTSHADPNTG